jgi:hypothetical protein
MTWMKTIVSVDVETDGEVPTLGSMRQLGSAAYTMSGKRIARFEQQLERVPGWPQSEKTMGWWKDYPEAWAQVTRSQRPPKEVMGRFMKWFTQFPKPALFMGPVMHDGMWLRVYLSLFVSEYNSHYWHRALDLRSVWWALTGEFSGDYREWCRTNLPGIKWVENPLEHTALNDAEDQAQYLFAILKYRPF